MGFEAYHKSGKLVRLMIGGLMFAAMGIWMIQRPPGAFDDSARIASLGALFGATPDFAGRVLCWLVALMGIGGVHVIWRESRLVGPAIRVDEHGIYSYRWSPKTIG